MIQISTNAWGDTPRSFAPEQISAMVLEQLKASPRPPVAVILPALPLPRYTYRLFRRALPSPDCTFAHSPPSRYF